MQRSLSLPLVTLTFVIGLSCGGDDGNSGSSGTDPDVPADRFVACEDGLTVADAATGLLWERKVQPLSELAVFCREEDETFACGPAPEDQVTVFGCADTQDANNRYQWSIPVLDGDDVPILGAAIDPDGDAYTDLLARLNGLKPRPCGPETPEPSPPPPCFAGHCDWRLPTVSELQTIMIGPDVTRSVTTASPPDPAAGTNPTGQSVVCFAPPCVDPDFAEVGGATQQVDYRTGSTYSVDAAGAYVANFSFGDILVSNLKTYDKAARAVRVGTCGS